MEVSNFNKDRKQQQKRRTTTPDLTTMVYGKVPPQARELEEAVLGAIMLEKGVFEKVSEFLKAACFYVDAHQRIFKAMTDLSLKSQPIDMLTVVEELKKAENLELVGGAYYVTKLTGAVVSSAHVEAHARIILQKFIQRELIRVSGEIINDAYEDSTDVFDLLDKAESGLYNISNNNLRKREQSFDSVLVDTYKRIEDLRQRNEDITGVPTGFRELDKLTFGWQPSDLIILAARPAMGKTAFVLNLARNAAMHPTKACAVALFNLEMSAGQLVERVLSAQSEIMLEKIKRGKMENHEMKQLYTNGIQPLSRAPLIIDDSAALNIFELRAKCRRFKKDHNIGIIIIDYLQLMSGTGEKNTNREQEISTISRNLKMLAKELMVPIIALSQLSRAVEQRGAKDGNKRPQLSDLRESGAIEQDADMVIFLSRPEYYDITQDPDGEDTRGLTEVIIAKHRNGSLDTIKLRANLGIQRFADWDNNPYEANGLDGSSWKPVDDGTDTMYIQTGSRMNTQMMDDDDDAPF